MSRADVDKQTSMGSDMAASWEFQRHMAIGSWSGRQQELSCMERKVTGSNCYLGVRDDLREPSHACLACRGLLATVLSRWDGGDLIWCKSRQQHKAKGKREAGPSHEKLAGATCFIPRVLPLALPSAGYARG